MQLKKCIVEKRNILNEIIAREFTLQELRLFSIYLGRINARDLSTRVVRLGINQFYRTMGIYPQKVSYLKEVTNSLLTKVVNVPNKHNQGYSAFQLFKRCKIDMDSSGKWFFEIDAHDDALQLMFDYKRDYFKYELWNVLNLESTNQFRMYELLKQYEWLGERIISVEELKMLLSIKENEYQKFNDFKKGVLNACQKALKAKTDIYFTYEPHARGGLGGKIQSLRFSIVKNKNYKNQLNLEEIFGTEVMEKIKQEEQEHKQSIDVSILEMTKLDFIDETISDLDKQSILQAADGSVEVIKRVYELAKRTNHIDNLVGFLLAMIKKDKLGELSEPVNRQKQNKFVNFTQRDYDYDEIERLEREQLKDSMMHKDVYGD